MVNREMLIEAAYGEADVAEFTLGPDRGVPAAGEVTRLDRAVTAGVVTFSVFLWALVLLLAARWLAGLFLAALPWSLAAYLALAAAAAAALSRLNWRATAAAGRGWPRGGVGGTDDAGPGHDDRDAAARRGADRSPVGRVWAAGGRAPEDAATAAGCGPAVAAGGGRP